MFEFAEGILNCRKLDELSWLMGSKSVMHLGSSDGLGDYGAPEFNVSVTAMDHHGDPDASAIVPTD